MKLPHLYSKASGRLRGAAILWIVPIALLMWSGTGQAMDAYNESTTHGPRRNPKESVAHYDYQGYLFSEGVRHGAAKAVLGLQRAIKWKPRTGSRLERWLTGLEQRVAAAEAANKDSSSSNCPADTGMQIRQRSPANQRGTALESQLRLAHLGLGRVRGGVAWVVGEARKNGSGTFSKVELLGQLHQLRADLTTHAIHKNAAIASITAGGTTNHRGFGLFYLRLQDKQFNEQMAIVNGLFGEAKQALGELPAP